MKLSRRTVLQLAAGAAAEPVMPRLASALGYPTRPITWVVPFPAGGPTDTLARIVTGRTQEFLGRPIVVENVAGAAGSIGVGRVAHAAPDGYTLIQGFWGTHVANGAVYKLNYDLIGDFAPIAHLANGSPIIVARKTMPASDLRGLIAWLRSNPDKALAGTAGVGSPQHIFGIFFQQLTNTRFGFVHYHGGAPAMQELMAGRIDLIISDEVTALSQIRGGSIRPYAVTTKTRIAAAPDIPTVGEAGLPMFHPSVWHAVWAPKGTPAPVIAKLNAAIVETLSDPAAHARIEQVGLHVIAPNEQTPEALGKLQTAEIEKWWPIIRGAGIKAE